MGVGLKALLKLPEARVSNTADQAQQFGRTFRLQMDGVNRKLRVMAAQASPSETKPLEGQRLRLIEAFQKTQGQIDPANPAKADKAIQRVMQAIDAVDGKADAAANGASAGRDQWLQREASFDDAMLQIGELQEAQHPKAKALQQLGDAIRQRANARNYQAAVATLDQLQPKLEKIYADHQQQADGEDSAQTEVAEVESDAREGLTILVRDAETGDAVESATVQIGDQTDTTSTLGLATVELTVGQQDYEISAAGFATATGSTEIVAGDNPELVVELAAGSQNREGLTLLVRDWQSGEAVEGAEAVVGDQTDTTSSNGLSTYELPVGTHNYEVTADGYDGSSGQVEVIEGDNPELVVDLYGVDLPKEGFTVLVRDSSSGEGIEGANVTVGNQSDVSSVHGLATVELPAGSHAVAVDAEGYVGQETTVEIVEGDNEELVIDLVYDEACASGEDHGDDDGDLTEELSDAERFVQAWDDALDDVSGQVEQLRTAMEGSDQFGMGAVRDGLATVMGKFPDLDLTKLVDAARANDQEAYQQVLQQTGREVREVRDLLANGPLLSTIDENPFFKTSVHATVTGVLDEIVSELGL